MTGAERLEQVREALLVWKDEGHLSTCAIYLPQVACDCGWEATLEASAALDGCVLLTAEEAERLRESFELWREGTPRRIEGRGVVVLADEEINWALALLTPQEESDA